MTTESGSRQANIGGLLAGAVIGGILGHQIGGGSGKDLATVGGVVAGAAVGNQVAKRLQDRDAPAAPVNAQGLSRCTHDVAQSTPHFWDVTYNFRGVDHHVQMATPPKSTTITVNADGEPRI